ncbi:MAG: S-methyl-5-thioribose-1-phosphate isomerase [Ignavibacteriales bacterium]|nr:MAG: S-methyl-5-thioribose-1-phosphate isomerase [Ignavibacteriales bacterium]
MKKSDYFSLKFENDKLVFIDQTKLPLVEEYIETDSYNRIAEAIERLEIRGAPLIGIAAAYALALSVKKDSSGEKFLEAYNRLFRTRPTAVNLFYALEEIKKIYEADLPMKDSYELLLARAIELHKKDEEYCDRIGKNGLSVFKKKSGIITHCNTGKFATGGDGTAFNVIKYGFEHGLVEQVFADETRPLLQGLRLTSFELSKNGIPFKILSDSSSGSLMQTGLIDFAVVGADRIALNGDTANKIGTFNLAVLCNFHNIPFYVAAPSTTIDRNIPSGSEIKIEFRNKNELLYSGSLQIAPESFEVYSPAFDVTPSHLISGIITEEGVFNFPYNFIQ